MARETKVQRLERERIENEISFNNAKKEYPARLRKMLVAYGTTPSFEIKDLGDDNFVLTYNAENWYSREFGIHGEMQEWEDYYSIESAEQCIREYHEGIAEHARREQFKRETLSKLTPEEREVLGL